MVNLLLISNSFGENLASYSHQILKQVGIDLHVEVLMVPGCSLETHAKNIKDDAKAYRLSVNGEVKKNNVSIKETLLSRDWDYIALQQFSGTSGIYDSFFPYIKEIKDYVVSLCPNSEIILHETWSYEQGSSHPCFKDYMNNQRTMNFLIKNTFERVAHELNIKTVIPSRSIVYDVSHRFNKSIFEDSFHLNTYGKMAIGLGLAYYLFDLKKIDEYFVPEGIELSEVKKIDTIVRSMLVAKTNTKVVFLGDSITEGAIVTSPEKSYVSTVQHLTGYKCINEGISGTRIAKQTKLSTEDPLFDLDMSTRVNYLPDADFAVFFGGTNDFGHGDALLGKKDDTTNDTFYGAVKLTFDALIKRFGIEKCLVLLPTHRHNENNPFGDNKPHSYGVLQDYRDILITCAKERNLSVIDLYDVLPPTDINGPSTYYADGLHPNDLGHSIIANVVAKYLKAHLK